MRYVIGVRVLIVGASLTGLIAAASADGSEPPSGPPWNDMCRPMEADSLRKIFVSNQCHTDFVREFAARGVPDIQAWMVEHRSCFLEWMHFSWLTYAENNVKMARLAWEHQLMITRESLRAPNIDQLLQRGIEGEISREAAAHIYSFLDVVEANTNYKSVMDRAFAAVRPICLYHANLECIGAMEQALTWMYPHSYYLDVPRNHVTFSMIGINREVFADTLTQKYASRLALDLKHAIEEGTVMGLPALYEMGLAAFAGDQDRFWKFMILYSTRGAAWGASYKMAHYDSQPLFTAFMVVSAAMGYIDTVWGSHKRAFSYSNQAESSCFQPKPYHFWMAAGYSYLLHQKGYSQRTSRLVARLLGAMYELGSTGMGRQPDAVFFVPTFDTLVNRTRREVAHHYIGAEFGLDPSRRSLPNFDTVLGELLRAAKPLPTMSEEQMRQRIKDPQTKWRFWTDLIGFYFHQEPSDL